MKMKPFDNRLPAAPQVADAIRHYSQRTGKTLVTPLRAVMFDMDGILYDSMPGHCRAWKQMCDENGIEACADEFYAYEGRTGASTIDILLMRQFGRHATEADIRRMYGRKSELFKAAGAAPIMPGAPDAVGAVLAAEALPVLVTGSGQASILERLDRDYPAAFPATRRVTAHDVKRGKPDPEPFLMGLAKAGVADVCAAAIDNAPLGVQAASAAGVFTFGIRTGPLPQGALLDAGADIELCSMTQLANILQSFFLHRVL